MKWAKPEWKGEYVGVARSNTGHTIVSVWQPHAETWRYAAFAPRGEPRERLGTADSPEEAVRLCEADAGEASAA